MRAAGYSTVFRRPAYQDGVTAIVDVVKGNDSFVNHGKVVPGFTATRGFDVASGWGTISAPRFVPSLIAAARAAHQDRSARKKARGQLAALTRNPTLSQTTIAPKQVSNLLAFGFLPGHLAGRSM